MIPFNVPPFEEKALAYMRTAALENRKTCGDGAYTQLCQTWLEQRTGAKKVLLTTSCTHALELAAQLLDIGPGDEVIMPSYTFSSTANAFVRQGATVVFVDIRPDTMNLDEALIEAAITPKTKAIVPVHYAGICCEMDAILAVARRHGLAVVEDAAQALMSGYKGKAPGSLGDMGTLSFHETKNYSMGEGGALLLGRDDLIERAEILREKGTDRSRFLRGQVDKYTWADAGSSFLPSDLLAAGLWAQLELAEEINDDRLAIWNRYQEAFQPLADAGILELPTVPEHCVHNAHMYYLKEKDLAGRTALIARLRERGVQAVFHYVPLHSSPAGLRFGRFHGEDRFTTRESDRLVRLPMWRGMGEEERGAVVGAVRDAAGFPSPPTL